MKVDIYNLYKVIFVDGTLPIILLKDYDSSVMFSIKTTVNFKILYSIYYLT